MPEDLPTRALDILNCAGNDELVFGEACPVGWEQMEATAQPRRRFCAQCQRHVHRCTNTEEAALRADQGECVAVPMWLAHGARREQEADTELWRGRPRRVGDLLRDAARRKAEPKLLKKKG